MKNVKAKLLLLFEPFRMFSDVLGFIFKCAWLWLRLQVLLGQEVFSLLTVLIQHCQGHIGT